MPLLLRVLGEIERTILSTVMVVMVVIYGGAVGVRWLLPHMASQVAWVDEATRFLLVWVVFLGLGLALAEGRHVSMSVFVDRFGGRVARLIRRVIDLTGLVFSLYVAWVGLHITQLVVASGQRSPTLGVSAGVLYATLPIGFVLLAVRYGASLAGYVDRLPVASGGLSNPDRPS